VQLDPQYSEHLKGSDAFSGTVEAILHKSGASPTCFVFSTNSHLDGREMLLREALEEIIGMGDAAFVSCIPGRLGFYEYDCMKSSYILSTPL